jgi:Xaa-Pro dipeptidase
LATGDGNIALMPWSSIDEVLIQTHLDTALAVVDAAMAQQEIDTLVIQAGDSRFIFQDDQTCPFRLNPWFAWLVPAQPAPGSLLELRRGHPPRLLLVTPDDYWHSAPATPEGAWTGRFHMQRLPSAAAAIAALQRNSAAAGWIGESPPDESVWQTNPDELLAELEQARCRKTGYELTCLREATRVGVAGHRAAEHAFRNGACEFDILLAFLAATRQGEWELPYPPIIALNEHGSTLHYQLRDRQPPPRPLSLLIDAGASSRHYASDITRTWAMIPGPFAALVEGMHNLQQELCEGVAPGVDWRQLHLRAHHKVAILLRDAGVLRMSADAAVATGVSSAFLPHGLGHLLGLQVHDVGGFRTGAGNAPIPRPEGHPALRLTRQLVPGMVVTVEPGLYFIDSLLQSLRAGPHASAVNWTLVEALQPFGGIRIEDNVLVTAGGQENLTRTAFSDAC